MNWRNRPATTSLKFESCRGFNKWLLDWTKIVRLPELAEHLGLASQKFRVDRILKGGMGECIRIVPG